MSRKASADSEQHGFADVIGVPLLALALLLLVAQLSFDWRDLPSLSNPPNKPLHNWIGPVGAHFAYWFFALFGAAAYLLPLLFAAFGAAYLFNFLGYLAQRSRWSLLWAAVLVMSVTGLLHILHEAHWTGQLNVRLGALSAGGFLGYLTYGQSESYEWGLC